MNKISQNGKSKVTQRQLSISLAKLVITILQKYHQLSLGDIERLKKILGLLNQWLANRLPVKGRQPLAHNSNALKGAAKAIKSTYGNMVFDAAYWEESDHPRDEKGRFTNGNASSGAGAQQENNASKPQTALQAHASRNHSLSAQEKSAYAAKVRSTLGVYRGKELGYYQDNPVIFSTQSSLLNAAANNLPQMGLALTEENSGAGGALSASGVGMVRLKVYGNPNTGQASSWTAFVLKGTGRNWPSINVERNEWFHVDTEEEAISLPGFKECLEEFNKSRPVIPQLSNPK